MARLKGLSSNLNAFLDMLSVSEGTSTNKLTKDDGYDVIVTGVDGPEIFSDYSKHPFVNRKPKQINQTGLYSSASGRYQHMRIHWEHYRDLLKLKDFGPESQDLWAIQLIKERKAIQLIEMGMFKEAIERTFNLWASLPGATYKDQKAHSYDKVLKAYLAKGGKLWESNGLLDLPLQPLPQSPVPSDLENTKVELKPMPTIQPQPPKQTQNGILSLILKLLKRN